MDERKGVGHSKKRRVVIINFKPKAAYGIRLSLVGSEMCIRDSASGAPYGDAARDELVAGVPSKLNWTGVPKAEPGKFGERSALAWGMLLKTPRGITGTPGESPAMCGDNAKLRARLLSPPKFGEGR